MSHSISTARRQPEGKEVAPALPLMGEARNPLRGTASTPHHSTGDLRWIQPLVMTAIDRCMTRQQAAGLLNISESVLSRKLSWQDDKCLNFREFAALGDRVALALHDELTSYYKLNDPAERVKHAMALVTEGMSMLVSEVTR